MGDSDRLRDRATQLLALARKAREDGNLLADELTRLATEAYAEADAIDRLSGADLSALSGLWRRLAGRLQERHVRSPPGTTSPMDALSGFDTFLGTCFRSS